MNNKDELIEEIQKHISHGLINDDLYQNKQIDVEQLENIAYDIFKLFKLNIELLDN